MKKKNQKIKKRISQKSQNNYNKNRKITKNKYKPKKFKKKSKK